MSDQATNEFYICSPSTACMSATNLVCLVICSVWPIWVVSCNQDKPNKPNRPNEQDRLADFFSILRDFTVMVTPIQKSGISVPMPVPSRRFLATFHPLRV